MTNADTRPRVTLTTSLGEIVVELDPQKAPISTANFLAYVDAGHYNGTIFHRVIETFMIQGGGFEPSMAQKPVALPPIKNEAANGLTNDAYTLAMARTSVVNSATAQFFINTVRNDFLNYRGPSDREFGYAVFGRVVAGTETVDKIKKVPTRTQAGHENVPTTPVVITSARRS